MALSFSDMFRLTDENDWKGNQQKRNSHQKEKNLSKIIMGKKKVLTMRIELMTFST